MNAERILLVVDDEPAQVELARRAVLKALPSARVEAVSDGAQAIDYLAGKGRFRDRTRFPLPSLMLLDLYMPKKTGFDVLEWRRGRPELAGIDVVVLTASVRQADLDRAFELHARWYLIKPINPDSLAKLLNLKILVVDDEPAVRLTVARELEKELGTVSIAQAGSPEELARELESGGFDLVVTDFHLRWTTGLEVLAAVKARFPAVPVIMHTATGSEEIAVEAMKAGLDDYVLKSPKHRMRLRAAVRAALDRIAEKRARREAESRYLRLFDSAPIGLYRTSAEGRILAVNAALIEMLGCPDKAAVEGRNVAEFYAEPSEREGWVEVLREHGMVRGHVLRVRRQDGTVITVEDSARAFKNAAGAVEYYEGSMQDVTGRVEAEHRIGHLVRLLRTISEINQLTVREQDRDRLLTGACRILVEHGRLDVAWVGLVDRATGEVVPAAVSGDESGYVPSVKATARPTERGMGPIGIAIRERRVVAVEDITSDPSMAPWREAALAAGLRSAVAIPLVVGGEVVGTLTLYSREPGTFAGEILGLLEETGADIAFALDGIRNEELRRHGDEERRLLATAVEQASDIIIVTDAQVRLLYGNPAFERIIGRRHDEVVGQPPDEILGTVESASLAEARAAVAAGAGWGGRIERRDSSGALHVDHLTMTPVHDEAGKLTNFVAVARDLTKETALEAQLRQAQKLEAIGQLAGGVAHDFNNLLQAMLTHAQLLRSKPDRLENEVAELEAQIHRGAALTRQLLLFARHEESKRERLDLNEVVRSSAKLLRRLLRENVSLALDLSQGVVAIEADGGQIDQVLMNLAVNAADAMEGGGVITIRTGRDDGPVWLEIGDTGHGMSPEVRERIFEPFFTTKAAGKGTGLGLSVVHGIVSQHGGTIAVESSESVGTKIRIVLPRVGSGEHLAVLLPESDTELPHGNGERVLVVEDEEAAREGLREILDSLGYMTTAAGSGGEAGRLPVEPAFDLLLTDLLLPDVDGASLARSLSERWPGMRVVLMSGYSKDEAPQGGAGPGQSAFLQKPFNIALLGQTLHRVLHSDHGVPS